MDSKVHYIVGIGRSGSTLLTTILNSHSQIKGIPEIRIIVYFLNLYNKKRKIDDEFISYIQEYLEEYQSIRPSNVVNLHSEKIETPKKDTRFLEYSKEVFSYFDINGVNGKKEIYIDKNPPYTYHYKRLTSLCKESKFIILVRDYRANILSRKQKQYAKSGNVAFNAFNWRFFHKEIEKYKSKSNCIVVRYEDLVSNLEEELVKICDFIDIEFEDGLLNYQKIDFNKTETKKGVTDKFVKHHFKGLKKDVYTSRINAWKEQLSAKEIKTAEQICGKIGTRYQYDLENLKRGPSLVYIIHFKQYIKACMVHYKEKVTFYLPIKFKMKRFKKSMERLK